MYWLRANGSRVNDVQPARCGMNRRIRVQHQIRDADPAAQPLMVRKRRRRSLPAGERTVPRQPRVSSRRTRRDYRSFLLVRRS